MKKLTLMAALSAIAFSGQSQAAVAVAAPLMTPGTEISTTTQVMSWFNDDFGLQGWTHFAKWGQFTARAGQLVTVTVITTVSGTHPGASVWWRNTGPRTLPYTGTTKGNYYQTHSFNQWDSIKTGILSSDTNGEELGYLEMINAAIGYDGDGVNTSAFNGALNPIYDGIPGTVTFRFRAPRTGVYQLAAGGISPSLAICPTPPNRQTKFTCNPNTTPMTYKVDIR